MASAATVSRKILKNLRDIMASNNLSQERLDRVVVMIAENFEAEVCSCYLMQPGEVLELSATKGLNFQAVHKTRLRIGEGLVGEVALTNSPLALADAWSHPSFAYRPETGEDIFLSFLGVPIIKGNQVIGVLVVQNKSKRTYNEEETETLETVATVLSEMIASGGFVYQSGEQATYSLSQKNTDFEGLAVASGIGVGRAVLHHRRPRASNIVAEDVEAEKERLRKAIVDMDKALDEMLGSSEIMGESFDILETYKMFAKDRGWTEKIFEYIENGLSAEAAVQKVSDAIYLKMEQISDNYIKEKLHDIQDLTDRLLSYLSGWDDQKFKQEIANYDNIIIIAEAMGPAQLLDYDRSKVKGVILEEGTPTMHVAIVARALNIPIVGNIKGINQLIEQGDTVIVDGSNGRIYVKPPDDIKGLFEAKLKERENRNKKYAEFKNLPAITKDGNQISLFINAGLLIDVDYLEETGAEGIGLYRTEIPFMLNHELPSVDFQTEFYRTVLNKANGRPVVFRTLDIGADKILPYWDKTIEANPAMGWRSIRITIDRRFILSHQVRAMIRAAEGRKINIMFPMVSDVSEIDEAKKTVDVEIKRELKRGGKVPEEIKIGSMIEVPSLVFALPELLSKVDFVSVGTNDLAQFLFACDRSNPEIVNRYDLLSYPFLRALKKIVSSCEQNNIPCSLCGEMASDPVSAMALIALGFTRLSMSAPAVGQVKEMIRSINLNDFKNYFDNLINSGENSIRQKISDYAFDHNVILN